MTDTDLPPGFTTFPSAYVGYTAIKSTDGSTEIHNLNGVRWHDAPLPKKRHHCWSQTIGIIRWFTVVHRCACGAISHDGKRWSEKNATRESYRKAIGADS